MSQLIVRNLDPMVKERLKGRARRHGRSMEAEARLILQDALRTGVRRPACGLGDRVVSLFRQAGLNANESLETLGGFEPVSPFDDDHR
jgi:antitoxin FitA